MESSARLDEKKDTKRLRVSIAEKERKFVEDCYNRCHGQNWAEVVKFARAHVVDAGLPPHATDLYLDQSADRLQTRMSRIIKEALQQPFNMPAVASTSQAADPPELIANQMRYAKKQTPEKRRQDAVKRKLNDEFAYSSSDEDEDKAGKKKSVAEEAQEAHKKMCQKAMKTMDSVNELMAKVNEYLKKPK